MIATGISQTPSLVVLSVIVVLWGLLALAVRLGRRGTKMIYDWGDDPEMSWEDEITRAELDFCHRI